MKPRAIVIAAVSVIVCVLFILPLFSGATESFNGFWDGHPYSSLVLSLLAVAVPLAVLNKVYDFYEDGNSVRRAVKFLAALLFSYLTAGAVSLAGPVFEFILQPGNHLAGWLGVAASALYLALVAVFAAIPFVSLIVKGIFGGGGLLVRIGSVAVVLVQLLAVIPLTLFIIRELWWVILVAAALLMLIGFASGGSSDGLFSSDDRSGDVKGGGELRRYWKSLDYYFGARVPVYEYEGHLYVKASDTYKTFMSADQQKAHTERVLKKVDTSTCYEIDGKDYYRLKSDWF